MPFVDAFPQNFEECQTKKHKGNGNFNVYYVPEKDKEKSGEKNEGESGEEKEEKNEEESGEEKEEKNKEKSGEETKEQGGSCCTMRVRLNYETIKKLRDPILYDDDQLVTAINQVFLTEMFRRDTGEYLLSIHMILIRVHIRYPW